jgi:hypothetical protein
MHDLLHAKCLQSFDKRMNNYLLCPTQYALFGESQIFVILWEFCTCLFPEKLSYEELDLGSEKDDDGVSVAFVVMSCSYLVMKRKKLQKRRWWMLSLNGSRWCL